MKNRRLISGIVIGAVVGVTIIMTDKNTRKFTKNKIDKTIDKTRQLVSQPSITVSNLRGKFNTFNQMISGRANEALNTLEKVEQALEKVEQTLEQFTHKS